jgi:hypothetical protein
MGVKWIKPAQFWGRVKKIFEFLNSVKYEIKLLFAK